MSFSKGCQARVLYHLAMAAETTAKIQDYLHGQYLPRVWRGFVDEKNGGFHERLGGDLRPLDLGYRRLLVQCRQIFVGAYACLRGASSDCLELARAGFEVLEERYWDPENA